MFALDHEFFLFDGCRQVKFLGPKFHLPAHIAPCRSKYSFNFTPGVGRTDGEAIERTWNETNPLATSTREMGPGSRRDVLDYHFGDHNWRKLTGLGKSSKVCGINYSPDALTCRDRHEEEDGNSSTQHGGTCD